MMNKYLVAGLAGLVLLSNAAQAAGDPARGKAKAAACFACHGESGKSAIAMYPHLAGQHADYIVHALTAYQKGTRNNEIMKGMAAPLKRQDMEDIAAYFAGLPGLEVKR